MSRALVVQCFIKTDTLAALCESLLRCEGREEWHLIFWSDVPAPGPKFDEYTVKAGKVAAYLEAFRRTHEAGGFASIKLRKNEQPLSTCATCKASIDYALSLFERVVFTEDDAVFASDALLWFKEMLGSPAFARGDVLAVAGESIFFDARDQELPIGYEEAARIYAERSSLGSQYTALDFMPSSCFATTREKWSIFGDTRGQWHGADDVVRMCKDRGYNSIFPIVARVKDVGMLHPDGHSVRFHGVEGVREIKNTYLMSSDLAVPLAPYRQADEGSLAALFRASTKLSGFPA